MLVRWHHQMLFPGLALTGQEKLGYDTDRVMAGWMLSELFSTSFAAYLWLTTV